MSGPVVDPEEEPIIEAVPARRPTVSDAPHRLHPLSWLFTLLSRLKVLLVPALVVLVMRRDDLSWSNWMDDPLLWAPLLGGSGVGLASLWQFLTYRYGIGEDALVIRSGVLERSLRVIPFARIHNVGIEQTLLHRLFRVAKVRLESAGSEKPEAEMEVLAIEDALALEALVRRRGGAAKTVATTTTPSETAEVQAGVEGDAPARAATAVSETLFALSLRETLLLGLLSHRGFVAVGAAFGALASIPGDLFGRLLTPVASGLSEQLAVGWVIFALSALPGIAVGYLAIKVLSVAVTLVQDFNFKLTEEERRLTTQRGLLSIIRASVSRRRIQSWTQRTTLLMRLMGRSALSIDIASRQSGEEARHSVSSLVPLATPETCEALVDHLLPEAGFGSLSYHQIPTRSWWRRALWGVVSAMLVAGALIVFAGPYRYLGPLLALLWVPYTLTRAWKEAQVAAWARGPELIAIRSGWPTQIVRFAEIDKLQAISLRRSVLDRRFGTATLFLDTAGASPGTGLQLRYLPLEEARTLQRELGQELARRPLRW